MTTKLHWLLLLAAACSTTSEVAHREAAPPSDNTEIANARPSNGVRGEAALIAAAADPGQFARACHRGNADACGALGAIYHDGVGVEQNYERAAKLFQVSCALGSASGCGRLAVMHTLSDKGVPKDTARALTLFQRACELGNGHGCVGAGVLLATGDGMTKNTTAARQWYERGCASGNQTACQLRDQLPPSPTMP